VGRTGTLIALDVLLQQLHREKAVGIAAFVQEMRLCRPLMVQTEVTLFQSMMVKCIALGGVYWQSGIELGLDVIFIIVVVIIMRNLFESWLTFFPGGFKDL